MSLTRFKFKLLTCASLFGFSSTVLAGTPSGSVMYLPSSLVAAAPVPIMDSGMLIALGLVLAVIALRVLKGRANYQKVVSVALFGGGLALAGVGVDNALATNSVSAAKEGCETGGTATFNANDMYNQRATEFYNYCDAEVTLTDVSVTCLQGWTYVPGATSGTKVASNGPSVQLPWCRQPPVPPQDGNDPV